MYSYVIVMPWIKTIDEKESKGELKQIYDDLIKKRGKISNILKIHSIIPKTLQSHLDLYLSIMFNKSSLKRLDKELIAIIVSSINKCPYCINHHKEALLHYWKDLEKINYILEKNDFSDLSEKQKRLVEFTLKLTKTPYNNSESDIKELKNIGYTDEEILEITLIVSYFNFVNRIALGLGIDYTDEEMKGYNY